MPHIDLTSPVIPVRRVIVTGAAGFIGSHLSRRLLADGVAVLGLDNLNDYYDPTLKTARLRGLETAAGFSFARIDLCDGDTLDRAVAGFRPDVVVNLAAQAGVRHSLSHPMDYVHANIVGFMNVLEACRHHDVQHLVYASSSSVYGGSSVMPFAEHRPADHPSSIYAATKRANELMAHAYSHLYGLPATGLRFFTVYGPWGRPDMAYFLFTDAIVSGRPLRVFGDGTALRDFTFVDDIVEAATRVCARPPVGDRGWDPTDPDLGRSTAPWRVFNIGHGHQVTVSGLIDLLEDLLGREAVREHVGAQAGDVPVTHADTSGLRAHVDYTPTTPLAAGLQRFVEWYGGYYGVPVPALTQAARSARPRHLTAVPPR